MERKMPEEWIKENHKIIGRREPTSPAPIAAQTEKCAVCDGVVDQTAAYQVNSGRWFHMQCVASSPLETPAAVPEEVWFCVGDIDPQPIGSGFATPAPADTGAAADDLSRCAVCGWPLAKDGEMGCRRGDCSQRPLPKKAHNAKRANAEYKAELFAIFGRPATAQKTQPAPAWGALLHDGTLEWVPRWEAEAKLASTGDTPQPLIIRCKSCDGTLMYKRENGEIVVYHDCRHAALGKTPDAGEEKEK